MRYRPFSRSGMAVSAISLALNGENDERRPSEWRDEIHAAFEEGVNAFELIRPSPALLAGFSEGASAVRRSLLFVALRIDPGLEGEELIGWVERMAGQSAAGEFNLLTADAGAAQAETVVGAMYLLKDRELAHRLAVAGSGDLMNAHVESGLFDALVTPFNLLSVWRDRNLVRTALERQMGVIACDPCPAALEALIESKAAATKGGWFKRAAPLAGVGSYTFLRDTPGWTQEQICLSFALTEPAIASVQVQIESREQLVSLAKAADRDLPSSVSAQIEMARFSTEGDPRGAGSRRSA